MSDKKTPLQGIPIPEQIEKMALERYCSPYGKANPETYAFATAYTAALELVKERDAEIANLNEELNIVHQCLTELYSYPEDKVGDIVKSYLDKIK